MCHWTTGAGRPQCRPRAKYDDFAYLSPERCSLPPRRAAGPGAHSVGQGLTVTAGLRLPPTRIPPRCHRSTGAGRPHCRPRANCDSDGCAYLRSVAHFLLAGLRNRVPTVSGPTVTAAPTSDPHSPSLSVSPVFGAGRPQCRSRANCDSDGCAYLRLPPECGSLPPCRAAGQGAHSVRANCDGCAYLRTAFPQCVTGLRGSGTHSVGQGLLG